MTTTNVTLDPATARGVAIWPPSAIRLGEQLTFPVLNVVPSDSLATARIDQSTFTYPLGELTVDNTSADWLDIEPGMMVWIGTEAGAYDVMVTVVRKDPAADTLYIAGTAGDSGVATRTQVALDDDQYVTVLYYKPPWSLLSRLASGTFYKQFDITYTDEGDDPAPVCNMGKWRWAKVPDSGSTKMWFPHPDAAPSYAQAGKTIAGAGYTWNVHDVTDGASSSIVEGGGASDATALIQFDPGFYIVQREITDSGGKTHQAETYVWVNDDSTYPALKNWRASATQDRQGLRLTVDLLGSVPESTVFPGAAFMLYEKQKADGHVLPSGFAIDTFIGYIDEEGPTRYVGYGQTQFKLLSPLHILGKIAAATQYVEEVASSSDWTEVSSDLSNPDGILWYLLQHHCPQVLQMFDFVPLDDTTLRKKTFTFAGRRLLEQLTELAELFKGNIGCAADGTLLLRQHPSLLGTTARNAIANHFSWASSDIYEQFGWVRVYRQAVGQVTGYGFSYAGGATTAYKSLWAGEHQGQGTQRPVINGLLLPSSSAQDRLDELVGMIAAQKNSDIPQMNWQVMRNRDVFDPARMRWQTLTFEAALDPRGNGFTALRGVPTSTTRRWQQRGQDWLKMVSVAMEPETLGQDGIPKEIPIDDPGSGITPIVIPPGSGISYDDPTEDKGLVLAGEATIFLPCDDGYGYNTTSGNLPSPVWTRQSLGVGGTPVLWAEDAANSGQGILVTTTGIYRLSNVHGSLSASLKLTFRGASSLRSMEASWGHEGYFVVSSTYADGVFETHSTDGNTFSAEAQVGSGYLAASFTDTFDFTVDNGEFERRTDYGTYVASTGWRSDVYDTNLQHMGILLNFDDTVITQVEFDWSSVDVANGSDRGIFRNVSTKTKDLSDDAGSFTDDDSAYGETIASSVGWEGGSAVVSAGLLWVTACEIQGYGTKPSEGGGVGLGLYFVPGVWLSSRTAGKVYTGAATAGTPDGYECTGFGAYSAMSDPDVIPGDGLCGEIHVPWQGNSGENLVYHGYYDSDTPEFRLYKVLDTSKTDISPSYGGSKFGPWQSRWQIQSYVGNRQKMLVFGTDDDSLTNVGAWVSNDGGNNWTEIVTPTAAAARYERGAISGDNGNALYLFGSASYGYSSDQGATIQDKMGNILTDWPSVGTFIGISGGG